jgi:hypothetical protein
MTDTNFHDFDTVQRATALASINPPPITRERELEAVLRLTRAFMRMCTLAGPDGLNALHDGASHAINVINRLLAVTNDDEDIPDLLVDKWVRATGVTTKSLNTILEMVRALDYTQHPEFEAIDSEICSLLDCWVGWCSPHNNFAVPGRTETVVLQTAAAILSARGQMNLAALLVESANANH